MTRRTALSLMAPAALAGAERKPLEFEVRWVNPPAKTPPRVSHKTLFSKAMGHEVGFNVYLPAEYEGSSARYPVLYWLHGTGSDENAGMPIAEMLDRAIEARQVPPVRFPGTLRITEWLLERPAFAATLARHLHPPLERYHLTDKGNGRYEVDDLGALRG